MSSEDLEQLGRSQELDCAWVPVAFTDLQALVADLDQLRETLLHQTRAEGRLTKLVTRSIILGESVPSAACRTIEEQRALLTRQEERIAELVLRAERAEAELSAEQTNDGHGIDHAMAALGFNS